jgi:hypothetical protein
MEGLPIRKQLQYLKRKVQIKEVRMDNVIEWQSIWKEMQNNLINQPRCPDHPEYPHVRSLAQGVINDILEVDEKGVRIRSHLSDNEDFIDAERFEIWWNHLLDYKSASLVPGAPNNPHLWRSRIVGAIIATCLPDKIKIVDPKTIELNVEVKLSMKGLLIKTPWIDKILDGFKTWEIRGSNTKIRGPIALIRSGSGTVVGICELEDVIGPVSISKLRISKSFHAIPTNRFKKGLPYPNTYAWVMGNIKRLNKPVPYEHPRGAVIWVNLSTLVVKQIRRVLS